MDFRTEIEVAPARFKISTDSKIMTVGSCFSEVIGSQLTDNKLQCLCNPYGTVFNPASIFKLISHSLQNQPIFKHLMLENNGIWQHYDFHSKFYAHSKEELEKELNLTHRNVNQFLRKANFLVITLGTSIVYQLKENSQIVSNCHKTPASHFKKELLNVKDIIMKFRPMYETLKMQNNKIKILLTVSPVRHTRETLQLNSVSKSILRTACYHLEQDFSDVHYFPSYEIMMDDLRDYRFYKADMIHPNEQAEQYIFEKFANTYFTEDLNIFLKEWNKVKMSLNHRPIQVDTPAHQRFLNDLLEKLTILSNKIDVTSEIELVRSQLVAA
ncbi:GSCFA domain protein [Emticicia oligotrophica DSM 17448]|uniref:GSCFA domain protein n=1 Tax=Emticicia oligotrophica (strain DSM 17448 / CIP 109782 / MTCC 6937 / GPTSA100-15) TaxID=929562 RepID=A0ABN4AQH9_EMTOG|nr:MULTISPECIES: GSCFA domain-containing protein [Emticicia]AFK04643.1 GSCFA domain protein [Emticicia oligotrophica DSM 17448]